MAGNAKSLGPRLELLQCRNCGPAGLPRIELERVTVAGGGGLLICVACDLIAVETEFAEGGPVWAAGTSPPASPPPRPVAVPRPKRAAGAR